MPGTLSKTDILIIGGAGFVGSNLVKMLQTRNVNMIHVVDNLLSSERINVSNDTRVTFTEASITNDTVLINLKDEYDFIFHLATYHGNQNSIHNPLADHENNTITTLKLYEKIKDFKKLKKVVYSSAGCSVSEKTFDKSNPTAEVEKVSLMQDSPYSMSKIFGEFYSNYYFKQHGLPAVRARFQNVYGPGEILGAGKWRGTYATVWRNVVPTFIYKALKKKALPIENQGITTRDFIFVTDIVEGLIACALKGTSGQAYNIATEKETSILQLAEKINTLAGNPTPINFKPKREWDNSGKRYGSIKKSQNELGFSAKISLDKGLERTIYWTRDNLKIIESIMAKHKTDYDYEKY